LQFIGEDGPRLLNSPREGATDEIAVVIPGRVAFGVHHDVRRPSGDIPLGRRKTGH
jgi:hypothetical protein